MNIKKFVGVIAIVGSMLMASTSMAAAEVIVNADGTGFVGKGDVQLVYGWSNAQLQNNASSVKFQSTMVTERTWECTNSNNDRVQPRARDTSSTQLVSKIDRERKQITGFILDGHTPGTLTTLTDGPSLNSCPAGPWTLTSAAGDPVLVFSSLQVSFNGGEWMNL